MVSSVRELDVFVKEALAKGKSRAEIGAALLTAGWGAHQAKAALAAFSDVPFDVPVPRPRAQTSAREAFLYIVMFSALFYGAFNLGDLFFEFIDRLFPDPSSREFYRSAYWDGLRWDVSSIIVAFPVFFTIAHLLAKEVARDPIKRLSGVRRWLTYITLCVAAAVLMGDVTALIYHVLGGEVTARFFSKVCVVAAIAGSIFTYYLLDLRKDEGEEK